ncbi:MAG: phospholipid/cholesterol/gamma-HCH transport system substrate-binding protein [Acidobacteriota bacterium]|nr:phospholipid/cholesterol/gamma-HCH transport system substrate-binding protein [Acidobacteriota bacterium]
MPRSGSMFRVGLVILVAFAVLATGIFLIGDKNNLFSRKNRYFIEFNSVSGLKPGNPVQLNGVDVGTVDKVVLPQNPAEKHIQIWISVDSHYGERIRGPVDPLVASSSGAGKPGSSQARIKTLGLLGDKYIDLSTGAPELPAIPNEGQIPAAQPTNVDALLASGEDVMSNVVEISASLSTILGRMERGEGLLGELTTDSESGRRLSASILGTTEALERIASTIENGEGPLGRLLNDKAMANQLASSLDRFESLLTQAQSGPGLAPALLNDPAMKTSFQDTLAQLNQVARDLQGLTADLETREGLVPRLVYDEEYGRKVTGEVQAIVDRLSEASRKLTEGNGTVPMLLNDPQIYDAVNDVIIGVNESRILRWLIRNRQKKGIERRYKDEVKAIESEGGTPPPLDKGPDVIEEETPAELMPEPTPEPTPTPPPPEKRDAPRGVSTLGGISLQVHATVETPRGASRVGVRV